MAFLALGLALALSAGPTAAQDTINLQVTYFDFRGPPDGHPNMGMPSTDQVVTDRVLHTLGADGLPVWNPNGTGSVYTNANDFNTWYRPTEGQNIVIRDQTLPLTRNAEGYYVYENTNFYPLDGRGWTAVQGPLREEPQLGADNQLHNFYMTMHGQAQFTFRDGQTFRFSGDDDLWVFFDHKLGIDLGGIHPERSATIGSAQLMALGLQPGVVYDLDIFFAERHVNDSNFSITTSLDLRPPSAEQIAGSEINAACACAAEPALFVGMAEMPLLLPSNTQDAFNPSRLASQAFITRLLSDQRYLMLPYALRLYPAGADGRIRGRLCYGGFYRGCFDDFYLPSATGTGMAVALTGGGAENKLLITITPQSHDPFGLVDINLYRDDTIAAVGNLQHMSN